MKLRKSHYGLKFGGMMQFAMKRITVWNGHAQLMFTFYDLGWPRMLSFSERLVYHMFWIYDPYMNISSSPHHDKVTFSTILNKYIPYFGLIHNLCSTKLMWVIFQNRQSCSKQVHSSPKGVPVLVIKIVGTVLLKLGTDSTFRCVPSIYWFPVLIQTNLQFPSVTEQLYFNNSAQDYGDSSVSAMELPQYCAQPLIPSCNISFIN